MASFAKDDNNNNETTPLINPEGKIFTNEWSSDCNPVTGSILNKQNLRLALIQAHGQLLGRLTILYKHVHSCWHV